MSVTTTRTSLLCVRSTSISDTGIRAWDGDNVSHTGIRIDDRVIDATFWHGVKEWGLGIWLQGRTLVDDVPIYPSSLQAEREAIDSLRARIGQRYDVWEIAGFLLLRDLGDPERPICSRLSYDHCKAACGLRVVGKQGRMGPRLVRSNLTSFNDGLLAGTGAAPLIGELNHA